MSGVLEKIAAATRLRVARAKENTSAGELAQLIGDLPPIRPFARSLLKGRINIIAEIKRASPSEGVLSADLDPAAVAASYAENGAAAVSVLTEPDFFLGSLEHLRKVRAAVSLPLLDKDFLLDDYQILQARLAGADCVLLIVALLGPEGLVRMLGAARSLGLETLVEVHEEAEMKIALDAGAELVGVNNRNLRTLDVDLEVSRGLARYAGRADLVCESGLKRHTELQELAGLGYRGFLIGTHLIKSGRPGIALSELIGKEGGK